jgi:hypothetical protein
MVRGAVQGAAGDVHDPNGEHAAAQRLGDGQDVPELPGGGDADDGVPGAEGGQVGPELAGGSAITVGSSAAAWRR